MRPSAYAVLNVRDELPIGVGRAKVVVTRTHGLGQLAGHTSTLGSADAGVTRVGDVSGVDPEGTPRMRAGDGNRGPHVQLGKLALYH